MPTMGERIKTARMLAKLTQNDLGKAVGLSGVAIMRYEKDLRVPKIKILDDLSKVLNVSVGYLMGLEDLGADFWGKEADSDTYEKLARNIEKFHGEKKSLVEIGEEEVFTDDEMLKINCAAVSSYMEKMNRAGQAVAVQTVKTLADMPEYQKKDEPGQK